MSATMSRGIGNGWRQCAARCMHWPRCPSATAPDAIAAVVIDTGHRAVGTLGGHALLWTRWAAVKEHTESGFPPRLPGTGEGPAPSMSVPTRAYTDGGAFTRSIIVDPCRAVRSSGEQGCR
jgi:hypothetical protein